MIKNIFTRTNINEGISSIRIKDEDNMKNNTVKK